MNSEAQVLTFVFTDIEGSTRLLRRLHDEYARLLDEHHALLDKEFRAGGGRRLAAEGDGGFFVFDSSAHAVRAAVSAQQALERHPWPAGVRVRVRMGMHTGEAVESGPNTYVGLAVHLAARISALGR
ncbi:MAG: adenylate/guanylate cyclase domain-containing protein, partial [Acidimicrobiia bacterium]